MRVNPTYMLASSWPPLYLQSHESSFFRYDRLAQVTSGHWLCDTSL